MKKLFLSSSFAQVEDAFAGFVGDDGAGKRVTFIATASVVEKVNFYVEQGRQALQRQGLEVDMLDISTATPENRRRMLQDNDYIYVSGGNTFYLRQELRRTGADQDLVQEVESGTPYLGESAGAMVVASAQHGFGKVPRVSGCPGSLRTRRRVTIRLECPRGHPPRAEPYPLLDSPHSMHASESA